ncbi:hypothetical protein EPO34_00650 [Patescibacteria group bacterium]|nr:MAG: hypothetical protein EPO34_00650 [Patescibacteria group bacterium]
MHTSPIHLRRMSELLEIGDPKPYEAADNAFSWILLRAAVEGTQSILIVGDVGNHLDLFLMHHVLSGGSKEDAKKRWAMAKARNSELCQQFKPQVYASGVITRRGEAVSWESKWFAKKTPEEIKAFLKDELLSTIRMHFPEPSRRLPNK